VARARLLAQTFVRDQIENSPVDDAQIKQRYEERFSGPGGQEYKARHILLETEDQAKAVIAELDSGADFATLAKDKSTGPSGKSGGDLGWFEPGMMVGEFSAATAALTDGNYSKAPVKTQFGWHVILREQSRDLPVPTLESKKEEIRIEIQQERVAKAITDIRDQAKIELQSEN
jgi:peptidyl-prolyl cis-trans isomerase C